MPQAGPDMITGDLCVTGYPVPVYTHQYTADRPDLCDHTLLQTGHHMADTLSFALFF